MAFVAARGLKIGTIIDKTLGVLEHNAAPALLYVAALTTMNGTTAWFALTMTAPTQALALGLLQFVIGIVAAYLLLDAMVRRTGLRSRTSGEVFYPYVGLSVLYTLGVILGLIVIILPGLLIMARWSLAQPMMVARGGRVMKTLGESWERTRGNEFPILVAALALLIVPLTVMIACSALFEQGDIVGLVGSQLATSAMSVIGLAMGVALYGLIVGRESGAGLGADARPSWP